MRNIFSEILDYGYRTSYKRGTFLFYRGDIGNDFYIIEDGIVELSVTDLSGEKVILAELKTGDFFGHIEIFTNGIRPTNAYVEAGTHLVSFTANRVRDFVSNHNECALQIIEYLCSVIDQGVEKIEDALVLNAYQKVSKKLYELGQSHQTDILLINQKKVSEFLAISEKTANVSLNKLREKGAIAIHRSRIRILDNQLLKQEFSPQIDERVA